MGLFEKNKTNQYAQNMGTMNMNPTEKKNEWIHQ